jgi:hypothetical protein
MQAYADYPIYELAEKVTMFMHISFQSSFKKGDNDLYNPK